MGKSKNNKSSSSSSHQQHQQQQRTQQQHTSDRKKWQELRHQRSKNASRRNGDPELVQFTHQLRLHRLGIKSMTGDGNCLFRVFADQIYGNDEEYYSVLRTKACTELRMNQDNYAPFIIAELDDDDDDGNYNSSSKDTYSFDDYLEEIQADGTWGGNIEIQALSKACQVNVCIHQLNEPVWNIVNYPPSLVRTVHIGYQGGQHYDSIRYEKDLYSNEPPLPIQLLPTNIHVTGTTTHKTSTIELPNHNGSCSLHPSEKQVLDAFPNPLTRPSLELIQQTLKECRFDIDAAIEFLLLYNDQEDHNRPNKNCIETSVENTDKGTEGLAPSSSLIHSSISTVSAPTAATTASTTSNDSKDIPYSSIIHSSSTNPSSSTLPKDPTVSTPSPPSSTAPAIPPKVDKTKNNKDNHGVPRRNGPCPCGSLKLYRKCCESIDKAKLNKQKYTGSSSSSSSSNGGNSNSTTTEYGEETIQIMGVQI